MNTAVTGFATQFESPVAVPLKSAGGPGHRHSGGGAGRPGPRRAGAGGPPAADPFPRAAAAPDGGASDPRPPTARPRAVPSRPPLSGRRAVGLAVSARQPDLHPHNVVIDCADHDV